MDHNSGANPSPTPSLFHATGVRSKRPIASLTSDEADQDVEERDTKILSATNQLKIIHVGHDVT